MFLYVGNMDDNKNAGITLMKLDPKTNNLLNCKTMYPYINATRILIDGDKSILYCIDEKTVNDNEYGGRLYTFAIDKTSGELTLLNSVRTFTSLPCYISFDKEHKHLIVVNYYVRKKDAGLLQNEKEQAIICADCARVLVYQIEEDGKIGSITCAWEPPSIITDPTEKAFHFHCVENIPGSNLYLITDFGKNMIHILEIDLGMVSLKSSIEMIIPDVRPRYICFRPFDKKYIVNGENTNRLFQFAYDLDCSTHSLGSVQVSDVCPVKQADITFDASGKYVFDLLRNPNEIVLLKYDDFSSLMVIQRVKLGNHKPKGLRYIKHLNMLFVTCPNTRTVIRFTFDTENGLLNRRDIGVSSQPYCIVGLEESI